MPTRHIAPLLHITGRIQCEGTDYIAILFFLD